MRLTIPCAYDPPRGRRAPDATCPDGVQMLSTLPFLISTNSFGIISLLIFVSSSVVFMIPALSSRGSKQAVWFGVGSLLLLAEAAALIVLLVLVNNGTIWSDPLTY
jgi:hypothetical protein